ncbi:MAG TPA: HAD-IA family hydrolase [Streptosporangiaceae bacterium]|nr:HAD-IA family hydrolase [Streptosporangiaceae bacterium]
MNALLVDLGGVLFGFDHPHRLRMVGQLLGRPPEEVDALLWESGFSADCDAGRYPDAAAVRAQVREITGYTGTDEDLDAAWCSAFQPDQRVLGLLAPRRADLRYGVFTNNGPLEEEALTRLYPGVFEIFADQFFCHRLAANKPDPAVYRQVTELLGVGPEDISFVDDSADNVAAARRCGWTAVRYQEPSDLGALLG